MAHPDLSSPCVWFRIISIIYNWLIVSISTLETMPIYGVQASSIHIHAQPCRARGCIVPKPPFHRSIRDLEISRMQGPGELCGCFDEEKEGSWQRDGSRGVIILAGLEKSERPDPWPAGQFFSSIGVSRHLVSIQISWQDRKGY